MRLIPFFAAFAAGSLAAGCHKSPLDSQPPGRPKAEATVFTDSSIHARLCQPVRPNDDWRRVCVPKDQGLDVRRKP